MSTIFKEQLESVIRDYDSATENAKHEDASDVLKYPICGRDVLQQSNEHLEQIQLTASVSIKIL